MECRNHPSVAAAGRCIGCAEPFCYNCLVEINGSSYCAACKVMAVTETPAFFTEEQTIPCKEAGEALATAIISMFCFSYIAAPVALVKAHKAKQLMAMNPQMSGMGKATAAQLIAVFALICAVIALIKKAH